MTSAPAASALREQVARMLWETRRERFRQINAAFGVSDALDMDAFDAIDPLMRCEVQEEADAALALIRPAVLREIEQPSQEALLAVARDIGKTTGETNYMQRAVSAVAALHRALASAAEAEAAAPSAEAGRETGV